MPGLLLRVLLWLEPGALLAPAVNDWVSHRDDLDPVRFAALHMTDDLAYDAVGGLTLGADPVATAMMHAAAAQGRHLDAFVVRKEGKAHGLQRRIEGPDVAGRRVLAVEDTSTTGNSVLTAVDALTEAGAEVVGVAVIVERGARPRVTERGLPYRAAYELSDLDLA